MSGYYTKRDRDDQDFANTETLRFDHLESMRSNPKTEPGPNVVYIHDALSGGDYGNDALISRANVNAFHNEVSDEWRGILYWDVIGSYGSFAIAVLGDVMFEDSALYTSDEEAIGRQSRLSRRVRPSSNLNSFGVPTGYLRRRGTHQPVQQRAAAPAPRASEPSADPSVPRLGAFEMQPCRGG